jgi:hypothetical protein
MPTDCHRIRKPLSRRFPIGIDQKHGREPERAVAYRLVAKRTSLSRAGRHPPLWDTLSFRLGQSAPYTVTVKIGGINRGTGLLPPGIIQPTGIDSVESQFVKAAPV